MKTLANYLSRLWPTSRKFIARSALLLGSISVVWLAAGTLNIVPFVLSLSGESDVRVHAAFTVGCLLIAAWGYWNE